MLQIEYAKVGTPIKCTTTTIIMAKCIQNMCGSRHEVKIVRSR